MQNTAKPCFNLSFFMTTSKSCVLADGTQEFSSLRNLTEPACAELSRLQFQQLENGVGVHLIENETRQADGHAAFQPVH
jgi:hypothetical protein